MSKEFQIRDGNLIASFDLENEDGDIDFCKLLKVSHGVAEEIGMFVDYVATNKIIKDQSKKIAVLETKLAEKDEQLLYKSWYKQYKNVMEANEGFYNECAKLREQLAKKEKEISEYIKIVDDLHKQLSDKCDFCDKTKDQDKISFAVEQLEKARKLIDELLDNCGDKQYKVWEVFDNQIKQLKEKE